MDNPYDVNTWSRLYREERLAEAEKLRLAWQVGATRPRGREARRRSLVASLVAALVIVAIFLASAACAPTDGPGTFGDRPGLLDGISLEARWF